MTREDIRACLQAHRSIKACSDEDIARELAGHNDDPAAPNRCIPGTDYTDAAVLIPLVERPEGVNVLLTQRTDHLNNHAGQISFPGGRLEEGEENDPFGAALRETEEEIGLPAERIEVIGRLDDYYTGTGFHIVPVVGWIVPPFTLKPDSFEVAEVFEVPLSFLCDAANYRRDFATFRGRERWFHAVPYKERYIWGATAGMLVNLRTILERTA